MLLFTTGLLLHSKNRRLIVVYSCICCRVVNEGVPGSLDFVFSSIIVCFVGQEEAPMVL